VWELNFSLANRGATTESFLVQLLGRTTVYGYPSVWEDFWGSQIDVEPLKVGGYGLGAETEPNVTARKEGVKSQHLTLGEALF
jgi:hypothetical protein